jgi:cobalt-zinc-cadmium efflux system protein
MAAHNHDHSHHHGHGHSHAHSASHTHGAPHRNETRLFWTALLTGSFMVVEAAGGLIAGSLALLADAGHMLMDFIGLAMAWLAFRVSRWPADRRRTYGFERLQVLVAFANGLALFLIAGAIVVEAVRRIAEPAPVLGGTMLWIAAIGLAVNIGSYFMLHGADRDNLNVRGAMMHVLGDLFGSAGAIAAALIILATGWYPADALISVLVAVIILRGAWHVVRDSARILLEAAPTHISTGSIETDLQDHVAGVLDVHHVHAWSITDERPMVTLHARIDCDAEPDAMVVAIKRRLHSQFGVRHATVEIELSDCADHGLGVDIAVREQHHSH